jgi:hypothetical protein
VVGKAVDTRADARTLHELWPARLEMLGLQSPDAQAGIFARCTWQPTAARRQGVSEWVIHNGTELARHRGYFGADVDRKATQDLASELKVSAIDWNKQMVLCLSAGLHLSGEKVHIARVVLKDKLLTVKYRLEKPTDGAVGLCYPAETVLVDRFDGEVRFVLEE